MKDIYLYGPTLVRSGDTQSVRYPHENPLSVSNAEEQRLSEQGVLASPPASSEVVPPAPAEPPVAD